MFSSPEPSKTPFCICIWTTIPADESGPAIFGVSQSGTFDSWSPCRSMAPRRWPVRGAKSSSGHQPPRARFQVHTPALGRSGACRRGRARPQNGAERAAARLCSTAAHGWRARAGSGAGGGSMRAGGLNLALGAAPLLRWAARGAVRDGHPRRAGGVQKGLEPLARGARCRMRARRP